MIHPLYTLTSLSIWVSVQLGVRHSPKVTSSLNSLWYCQEIQHPLAAFSTPPLPTASDGSGVVMCGYMCKRGSPG